MDAGGPEVYDDTAFLLFLISLVGMVILPWTASWVLGGLCSLVSSSKTDTDEFAMYSTKKTSSLLSWKNIVFVSLWAVFVGMVVLASSPDHAPVMEFDPYGILGVGESAEKDEIKSAYRKLSLAHHPDRFHSENPEEVRENEQAYVLIRKAYETLTIPEKKEQWLLSGSSDSSSGGYKGAFGLPSLLNMSENHLPFMLIYFIVFVVLFPAGIFIWWNKAKKVDSITGVRLLTSNLYAAHINNHVMAPKFLIEVLTLAVEFRPLGQLEPHQGKMMAELHKEVKEHMGKSTVPREGLVAPYVLNARVLIYSYLLRKPLPQEMKTLLHDVVLRHVHHLLKMMLFVSIQKNYMPVASKVMECSQCFTQQVFFTDSDLKQLPVIDDSFIKTLRHRKMKNPDLLKFKTLEDRTDALMAHFDNAKLASQLGTVLDRYPLLSVKADVSLSEDTPENRVYVGDVMNVLVSIKKLNTKTEAELDAETSDDTKREKKSRIATVDKLQATAPRFPYPVKEGWVVICYNETTKGIVAFEKVGAIANDAIKTLQLAIPTMSRKGPIMAQGENVLSVAVLSDSYRGIDTSAKVTVFATVRSKDEPVYKEELLDDEIIDEPEPEAKWYFLWGTSIWDLLISLVLLYFILLLALDMLHTKGYISSNPLKSSAPPAPKQEDTDTNYYSED